MRQHEKQEDMSLPQILEDIHDRICEILQMAVTVSAGNG